MKVLNRVITDYKKAKRTLKLKEITKNLKTEKDLKNRLEEYTVSVEKKRKEIYKEVRKEKIKSGDILLINAYEVEVTKKKGKIGQLFNKDTLDYRYTGIYFGQGKQIKIINLPKLDSYSLDMKEYRELFIYNEEKSPYMYNNKTVVFLNNKGVFNPNFVEEKNNFAYDLTPKYFWKLVNNVFDISLTIPIKDEGGLLGKLTPKKIFVALVIAAIIYAISKNTQGG